MSIDLKHFLNKDYVTVHFLFLSDFGKKTHDSLGDYLTFFNNNEHYQSITCHVINNNIELDEIIIQKNSLVVIVTDDTEISKAKFDVINNKAKDSYVVAVVSNTNNELTNNFALITKSTIDASGFIKFICNTNLISTGTYPLMGLSFRDVNTFFNGHYLKSFNIKAPLNYKFTEGLSLFSKKERIEISKSNNLIAVIYGEKHVGMRLVSEIISDFESILNYHMNMYCSVFLSNEDKITDDEVSVFLFYC